MGLILIEDFINNSTGDYEWMTLEFHLEYVSLTILFY